MRNEFTTKLAGLNEVNKGLRSQIHKFELLTEGFAREDGVGFSFKDLNARAMVKKVLVVSDDP